MSVPASAPPELERAGGEVRFWRCRDEAAEALAVAADVERLVFHEHVPPERIVVMLAGRSLEGSALLRALQERAIPHTTEGSAAALRRAEVRDAIAWLRLLLDPHDASAAARTLLRPPIEMRQVDLAQIVQIARRRRLDVVAALPAALESPQVPPEACERIRRFLALHDDAAAAMRASSPGRFLGHLLESIGLSRGNPLSAEADLADRAASGAWLQEIAADFERRMPWAPARELARELVSSESGQAGLQAPRRASRAADAGAVELAALRSRCREDVEHLYLVGLHAGALGDADAAGELGRAAAGELGRDAAGELGRAAAGELGREAAGELGRDASGELGRAAAGERGRGAAGELGRGAVGELVAGGNREVVISYPVQVGEDLRCCPAASAERVREELHAEWREPRQQPANTEELIEAALRTMRQELLDGVASIGGRLGELRLDTDVDVSHGVVRYLELVKLAALLERPDGQSVEDALADVNNRLLAAVTPLQREILESSTLDEELLAGRAGRSHTGSGIGRNAAGEPPLRRFLPRRGDGLLLSASDVETYRGCPLRYKFARVLRIPADPTIHQRFGIAVHQVLERYHADGGGELPKLMGLLDVCWRRAGFGEGEQERGLRAKASQALRRYHERLDEHASTPIWFERSFAFRLGRHHVRGRVDRVDRLPDGSHELIDYKTGRPRSPEQLRQDIQLSLYALAARESWQLESSREAYYYLLDDQKVPLPEGGPDPAWVRETVTAVGEAIMQERFDPTPSKAACGICDYRIACPVAER